jgi:hypothetical protein
VRNFERHGFWRLRGVPLMPQVYNTPAEATPHLSHPPAFTWVSQLFGDSEASFRWPTLITVTIAALCLYELLRPRFGAWPAFGAALLLLGMPGNAVLCQGSFEIPVLGAGMALLLATDRVLAGRMRWRVVQAVATFYGSWSDWGIAFLLPRAPGAVPGRRARPALRALLVPVVTGAVALALLVLWHRVAFAKDVFGEHHATGQCERADHDPRAARRGRRGALRRIVEVAVGLRGPGRGARGRARPLAAARRRPGPGRGADLDRHRVPRSSSGSTGSRTSTRGPRWARSSRPRSRRSRPSGARRCARSGCSCSASRSAPLGPRA